jgi:hypothetical protein
VEWIGLPSANAERFEDWLEQEHKMSSATHEEKMVEK